MKKEKSKNPHAVALGRLGGLKKGLTKARTAEQARAAGIQGALKRWGPKTRAAQ